MGDFETQRRDRRQGLAARLRQRVAGGARDERGAVAIIFALAIVVLVPLILGLFDVYTTTEQRARLQDALDAAALYAARSDLQTDAEIDALGDKALTANLKLIRGATLLSSDFHLADNNTKVVASARIQPLSIAPTVWAHPPVTVGSEVVRNSKNLEVALVLDVTGSMKAANGGDKIGDLRTAAQKLVDIVVKDTQTPFYSKVAVVPWSMGVNVGTAYADNARGAVKGTRTITAMSGGYTSQKTISAVSTANPAVVTTSSNHGFATGDTVMIWGITGGSNMTQLNGRIAVITKVNNTKFSLNGVNSSGYNSYSGSSGTVTKCARTDCALVVTANGHGYADGDYVFIDGVSPSGLDSVLDDNTYPVFGVTTNTFNIVVPAGPTTAYTSGGTSYCTKYGCEFYRFQNAESTPVTKLFQASTCVSERTGTDSLTDVAPSTSRVGFTYPPVNTGSGTFANTAVTTADSANPCLTNEIIPLSTDKADLKAKIGVLAAAGSTAGQVGTAWGWYMVSPSFGYLWPNASQRPAPYTQPNTIKAVVLMTDGALNSPYCNGVIAKDALTGSGSSKDHHDCNATNGSTLNQSLAICAAMKQAGVIVYTVGFQIAGDTNAQTLMSTCATDASHEYLPTSGGQLTEAFKAIGAELNNLRVAH